MSKTLGSSALGLSPMGVERECWCRGVRAQQPPLQAPPLGVPLGLSLWTWLGNRRCGLSPCPMPVLRLALGQWKGTRVAS